MQENFRLKNEIKTGMPILFLFMEKKETYSFLYLDNTAEHFFININEAVSKLYMQREIKRELFKTL